MQIITGGFSQGKLNYAINSCTQNESILVLDETNYKSCFNNDLSEADAESIFRFCGNNKDKRKKKVIINHLNRIIKEMKDREKVLGFVEEVQNTCEAGDAELIVISDELGCGIVPIDKNDREYRENNGRVMCLLAAKADSVVRLVCGIAVRIK